MEEKFIEIVIEIIKIVIEIVIEIVKILFLIIGGWFTYCQWGKSIKIKKAEYVNQIIDKLRFDETLKEAIYIIDYETENNKWYDISFHNDSEDEKKIDSLFSYFCYILYLREIGNISEKEFKLFKYQIDRICQSKCTQHYLWNLYHFCSKKKTESSFEKLIDYGIKNKFFNSQFKKDDGLYEKYLNF